MCTARRLKQRGGALSLPPRLTTPDGAKGSLATRLRHRSQQRTALGPRASSLPPSLCFRWDAVLVIRANEDTMPLSHGDDDEGSEARLSEVTTRHHRAHCAATAPTAATTAATTSSTTTPPPPPPVQERRLMYVAMTRARRRLCVSYVATGADSQPATASRFLRDLPADETVVVRATHYEMRHAATDASGAAFALPNAPTPRGGGGGYGGFGRTPGGGTAMSPRVAPADLGASSDPAARLGTWQGRAQCPSSATPRAAAEKKSSRRLVARARAGGGLGGGGCASGSAGVGVDLDEVVDAALEGLHDAAAGRQGAAGRETRKRFVVADDDSDDDLFQ